jgi:Holliday junction resolvase RusA-like endonuclease
MRVISFSVRGTPGSKGSAQAFVVPGKNGGRPSARVVTGGAKSTRAKLKAWDGAVREAAAAAIGNVGAPPFVAIPIGVIIEFRLRRPASHFRTGKHAGELKPDAPRFPAVKPDTDKLVRSTLDAMTGIVFDDDARVSRFAIDRVYASAGDEGASITVAPLDGGYAHPSFAAWYRLVTDISYRPASLVADFGGPSL